MSRIAHSAFFLWVSVASACSSPPPQAQQPPTAAPAPTTSTADSTSAPPSAEDAGGQAVADPAPEPPRIEVRNDGVHGIEAGTIASEESIGALFPECTATWLRLKGRATPHIQLTCAGTHVLDVILAAQGRSGAIESVWVHGRSVAPSGLGVGSSYRALNELTKDLVCRGLEGGLVREGVFQQPHTLCTDPMFPHVAYVFRDVVFWARRGPNGPKDADTLRIQGLRWLP